MNGKSDLLDGPRRSPVEVERAADHTTVRVHGDLQADLAAQFRRCVVGLVDDGARDLVIELDDVPFCDSTGLGVLVGAHRTLEGVGGHLSVVHPRPAVRHLLERSGLDRVFDVA